MHGPLGDLVKQDSRNAAWLGNAVGWQGLEDEGNHNVQNPGRAVTKAAISAATYGIGSYLAGLYGAAGAGAAGATGTAADTAATTADTVLAQQLAQQAAQQSVESAGAYMAPISAQGEAAINGLGSAGQTAPGVVNSMSQVPSGGLLANSAYGSMVPGLSAGSQQAQMLASQTGDFGPAGLGQTMQAASTANGLSPMQQMAGNIGGKAMGLLGGGSTAGPSMTNKFELMKTGYGMLNPEPPPPAPPPQGRPAPPGPQEPMQPLFGNNANPIGNGPFGPGGNSLGMSNGLPQSLTPEMLARLRAQGLLV